MNHGAAENGLFKCYTLYVIKINVRDIDCEKKQTKMWLFKQSERDRNTIKRRMPLRMSRKHELWRLS